MATTLFGARGVRALVLMLAVAVGMSASVTAAPRSPEPAVESAAISASQFRPSAEECAMLWQINNYRAQNGRRALVFSRTLGAAAEHHSQDMAVNNVFSHTLSDGTSWSQNIRNHGYTYSTYRGENIAAGYADAARTFNQWKNSSGHRANMLSSNFKAIGIGQFSQSGSRYTNYWTTTFGGVSDGGVSC